MLDTLIMAQSKEKNKEGKKPFPLKRLIELDKMFRNGKGYTLIELQAELEDRIQEEIGTQMLKNNINAFESEFGAKFDMFSKGHQTAYKYKDSHFSIFGKLADDIEVINRAIRKLEKFKGNLQFDVFRYYLQGLASNRLYEKPMITFDNNPKLEGMMHMEKIACAVLDRKALDIVYAPSFSKAEVREVVHPYHLRQYNNRWFLFAWSEKNGVINNYAIDRIRRVRVYKCEFRPSDVDFEKYLEDVVGVSNNRSHEKERVVIRVHKKSASYVESKPIHHSQRVVPELETPDTVTFEMYVKVNVELKMQLLSYSDAIEVLEPAFLRKNMHEKAKRMLSFYEKDISLY